MRSQVCRLSSGRRKKIPREQCTVTCVLLCKFAIKTQAAFWELFFCCSIFFESNVLAFSSSRRRVALKPLPARLMKYVSIRMPEEGPLGETFLEASDLAMVAALLVNNPA